MTTPAWADEGNLGGSGMLGQIRTQWGVLTEEQKQPYTEAALKVSLLCCETPVAKHLSRTLVADKPVVAAPPAAPPQPQHN